MSARWRLYFPKVEIRFGVVALLAFGAQLLAMFAPLGSDDLPRRILLVLSYLALFGFVALNLRRPGVLIMGAGLLLNFLPIIANGGLMPVSPQALADAGYEIPPDVSTGDWIPDSKDVLLERDDARFYFLSDRLVWADLPKFRAFSIGDVVIFSGLLVVLLELLLPRLERLHVNGAGESSRE